MGHLIDTCNLINLIDFALTDAVPAKIDLGSPRNKDCPNFGICRINYYNGNSFNLMPSCCPNRAYGYIRKQNKGGVEIILPFDKMAPATQAMHLGTDWFTINDEYELPEFIAKMVGLDKFLFKPGIYPIVKNNGCYYIAFN